MKKVIMTLILILVLTLTNKTSYAAGGGLIDLDEGENSSFDNENEVKNSSLDDMKEKIAERRIESKSNSNPQLENIRERIDAKRRLLAITNETSQNKYLSNQNKPILIAAGPIDAIYILTFLSFLLTIIYKRKLLKKIYLYKNT